MRTYLWIAFVLSACAEEREDHRVPFIPPAPEPIAEAPAPAIDEAPPIVEAPRPMPRPAAQPRPAARREVVVVREPVARAPGVAIARVVPAREVVNREPGATPDASAERTFLFVEAANPGEATELAISFVEPSGVEGAPIALELPTSQRWRTWATTRRTFGRPGAWTAIVRDSAGRELARREFDVAPGA